MRSMPEQLYDRRLCLVRNQRIQLREVTRSAGLWADKMLPMRDRHCSERRWIFEAGERLFLQRMYGQANHAEGGANKKV